MKGLLLILCLLVVAQGSYGQYSPQLQNVVDIIKRADYLATSLPGLIIEDPVDPKPPRKSLYDYYGDLCKLATSEQLLEMTGSSSKELAIYALWALAKRNDPLLDSAFVPMLNRSAYMDIQSGCMIEPMNWYAETRWELIDSCPRALERMDSIVLYTHHYNSDILAIVLRREIPSRFQQQVEFLAFTWNRFYAIVYLARHDPAKFHSEVKNAMLTYMDRTRIENRTTPELVDMLDILLKYRQDNINKQVIKKLRHEPEWTTRPFCVRAVDSVMKYYGLTGYK